MKKIAVILAAVICLVSLCACSGTSKSGQGIPEGTYKPVGFTEDGGAGEVGDEAVPMFNDISLVILGVDTAEMVYGEQNSRVTYRLEGESFTLNGANVNMTGVFKDNKIVLFSGEDRKSGMIFKKID
ncbi:MAG: hypothetical protein J5590_04975 [Clostridia bacterium]|nr:hypothetical protein [Clostridia bacterium]